MGVVWMAMFDTLATFNIFGKNGLAYIDVKLFRYVTIVIYRTV